MAWFAIGIIAPKATWAFTAPVTSSLFRVQHSVDPPLDLRQGLIAQASLIGGTELMNVKRLYSKQEFDIYEFLKPDCWTEQVIAIRNGYYYSNEDWTVTIETWII